MAAVATHAGRVSAIVPAPFGAVGFDVEDGQVVALRFLTRTSAVTPVGDLACRVAEQLEHYFAAPEAGFDLPLAMRGTPFQRAVWQQIAAIPCGRTRTYGELAAQLDAPARAVGQACGDNRLPIVIPCHRVIGAAGLGGFAHHADGFPLGVKRWLLEHEGALRGPLL